MTFIGTGSVDVVIFIGTLAHVYNLRDAFMESYSVLNDKGIILIVDSNADRNILRNIGGSYVNYGLPKAFLEGSVHGFKLAEYFYMDDRKRRDPNGSKFLAVLRKNEKL